MSQYTHTGIIEFNCCPCNSSSQVIQTAINDLAKKFYTNIKLSKDKLDFVQRIKFNILYARV